MAKRIKYQIGDIFLLHVEYLNEKAAARVLKRHGGSMLIEVFNMGSIEDAQQFDIIKATEKKPILVMWCYDTAVKNGEWEIIANAPVSEYEDIYFWTNDGTRGYCLIKGNDTVSGEVTEILISKEETKNYSPYGITNEIAIQSILTFKFSRSIDGLSSDS